MRCRDIQPLLSKLRDEALSPREMKGLAAHLEECLACCGRREVFQEIGAGLREFVEQRLPDDVAQRPLERRAVEQWRAERDTVREPGRRTAIIQPIMAAPPSVGAWRLALAALALAAVGLGVAHWESRRPRGSQ